MGNKQKNGVKRRKLGREEGQVGLQRCLEMCSREVRAKWEHRIVQNGGKEVAAVINKHKTEHGMTSWKLIVGKSSNERRRKCTEFG